MIKWRGQGRDQAGQAEEKQADSQQTASRQNGSDSVEVTEPHSLPGLTAAQKQLKNSLRPAISLSRFRRNFTYFTFDFTLT